MAERAAARPGVPAPWRVCAAMWFAVLLQAAARGDDAAVAPAPAAAPTPAVPAPATAVARPEPPPAPPPIDQQPYRVLVAVGIAPSAALDAAWRERLPAGLRSRIATRLGPFWSADVAAPDWLTAGRAAVLEQVTAESLTARYLPTEFDKVLLATVEAEGPGVRIAAREWDRSSQSCTALRSTQVLEPRIIVDRLFAELVSHFRPLAVVEEVGEGGFQVELRLQGGELLPPDPLLRPLAAGAYLRPFIRHFDRKKQLKLIQSLPWTYVHVTNVERGRLAGEVKSVFSGVLSGSRRGSQALAIAVKPQFEATDLVILPRGQPDNPHSGVRVEVLNRQATANDPVTDRLTLYTDRSGVARIPVDREHPLRYVFVMSGKSVLATVPFIPGDQPRAEVEIPDDAARLGVEGEIALLEAELIEIVARREVTAARLLGHARAGEWEPADKLILELKNLPTRETIRDRLERIRLPAMAAARAGKNRTAESRINQMCTAFSGSVEQFLPPDRLTAVFNEVRELRQVNPAAAPAGTQ